MDGTWIACVGDIILTTTIKLSNLLLTITHYVDVIFIPISKIRKQISDEAQKCFQVYMIYKW
jgi:hypothetical protein